MRGSKKEFSKCGGRVSGRVSGVCLCREKCRMWRGGKECFHFLRGGGKEVGGVCLCSRFSRFSRVCVCVLAASRLFLGDFAVSRASFGFSRRLVKEILEERAVFVCNFRSFRASLAFSRSFAHTPRREGTRAFRRELVRFSRGAEARRARALSFSRRLAM